MVLVPLQWLKMSEANEVPINKHSNSFETFKKIGKKLKYIFMTILGIAELFETINRPGPTVMTLSDGLFFRKYQR